MASTSKQAVALMERFKQQPEEMKLSLIVELKGKESGFALEPFLHHYLTEESERVREGMVEYLSKCTEPEFVPIVTKFLDEHQGHPLIEGIITSCWQSSLDFAEHLKVFVKILAGADYQKAFEAFTVIENASPQLTSEQRTAYIGMLHSCIEQTDTDKQNMLIAMIKLLE